MAVAWKEIVAFHPNWADGANGTCTSTPDSRVLTSSKRGPMVVEGHGSACQNVGSQVAWFYQLCLDKVWGGEYMTGKRTKSFGVIGRSESCDGIQTEFPSFICGH